MRLALSLCLLFALAIVGGTHAVSCSTGYQLIVMGDWDWSSNTYYPMLGLTPAVRKPLTYTLAEGFDTDDLQNFTAKIDFSLEDNGANYLTSFFVNIFDLYQGGSSSCASGDSAGLPYSLLQVVAIMPPSRPGWTQIEFMNINTNLDNFTCPDMLLAPPNSAVTGSCHGKSPSNVINMTFQVICKA